jgi:hypothetical protein
LYETAEIKWLITAGTHFESLYYCAYESQI